jgi:hypothetical protein
VNPLPRLMDDDLSTPPVGGWSEDKYRHVQHYAEIFATSMKNKWPCRVYVDLFAGTGRSMLRESGAIVPSSPLLALGIRDPFDKYVFCDADPVKLDAARQRVTREYPNAKVDYVDRDVKGAAKTTVFQHQGTRMKHILIALTLLMLPFTADSAGKAKPVAAAKTPKPSTVPDLPNVPAVAFDPTWASLPPAFQPSNVEAVIKALNVAPKGEFETEEAFQKRSAPESREYLFAASKEATFKYDAERQRFVLPYVYCMSMSTSVMRIDDQVNLSVAAYFSFGMTRKEEGSFVGQNSFGAKATIEKVKVTTTDFLLPVQATHLEHRFPPYMDVSKYRGEPRGEGATIAGQLEFPIPLEVAEQLKPHLVLGWVWSPSTRVSKSPVVTGTSYTTATVSSPTEGTHITRYIVVDTLWAIVYDDRDRKLYMVRSIYPPK